MTPLLYVLGLLLAALGIGASIALHEVGHLVPAKRFGVRVTQYMVGFGPTAWSRHRGETEYGFKLIPLGGYIRMIGMFPPPKGAPEGAVGSGTTGRFQLLAEQAREAAWEEVTPGDQQRVFYRLPVRKRVAIMLGGPMMNLLIALGLFAVLLMGIGKPFITTEIARVSPCTPAYMATAQSAQAALADPPTLAEACPAGAPASPAALAGLTAGDRITAIDGTPIADWEQLLAATRGRPGQTLQIQLTSPDGAQRTVPATLAPAYRPTVDAQSQPTGQVGLVGYLGIVPGSEYVPQSPATVVTTMWDMSVASAQALLRLPVRVAELASTLVSGGERDPQGPVSVVGVSRLSGEVAAASEPVKAKAVVLLSLLAGLNLFLFLFNLIPLLPLDGGHVAGALWEALRRWLAQLRGRPDPGPVDVAKALPVAYAVGIAMIVMGSIVILADIIKPLSLYG